MDGGADGVLASLGGGAIAPVQEVVSHGIKRSHLGLPVGRSQADWKCFERREERMLKLRIQDDGGEESEVPISRDEITIGRAEGNTIRLTARNVSRQHAKLIRDKGGLFIEPVSARYGIVKNGQRILDERTAFGAEDVILIGDYRLVLDAPKSPVLAAGEFSSEPTELKQLGRMAPRRTGFEGTEILPAMPAKIVIVSSNFAGQEFPLAGKDMVIGRGEECDIIVDHRSVSQMHAKIVREHGKDYQIFDLNSKNGVCIQGEKYTSTYLKRGDIVELGHVKFRFVEPGENYVFTPQAILEDDDDIPLTPPLATASGLPKVLGVLGVLILLGLVAVGAVLLREGPAEVSGDGGELGVPGAEAPAGAPGAQAGIAATAPKEVALDSKTARGVERAKEMLADGEVDQAIGVLEGLKMMEPSPEELEAIESLIVDARAEKPFKSDYILARTHLQDEDYEQTLSRLKNLPDHTLFAKLAREQEWEEKAQAGLLKQARQSREGGDKEEALALVTTLLEYDPDDEDAQSLRDDLRASVAPPTQVVRKERDERPVKRPPKKPTPPKLSTQEATELRKSAFKKLLAGDLSGSLKDCTVALQNGVLDCHRLMGQAYEKQGDKERACKYFKKAQKSTPNLKAQLQKSIDKLECDT